MKTLVLGATGMVGHKLVQQLSSAPMELFWTTRDSTPASDPALRPVPALFGGGLRAGFDVTRAGAVDALLRELRPDVVVNCVGVIKQRSQAHDADLCRLVNAELPHRLAAVLSEWRGRLIHISTDCVFDGQRGGYSEDDRPNATDIYGLSKARGEVSGANCLTLRTSVIGRELRHHGSLLDWFLAQSGRTIRGFRSVRWSGITSITLAQLIERLALEHPMLSGIFHVASAPVSKHDLLLRLRDAYGIDVSIVPDDSTQRDMTLSGTRFERATGLAVPSWDAMIATLVGDPTPYLPLSPG